MSTHKLKLRSRLSIRSNVTASNDTSFFLRSLFLPSASTPQDEGFSDNSGLKNVNHHRQGAHSRPNKHKKIRSFPNNLAAAVHTHGNTEPLLMSGSGPISEIMSTFTTSAPVLRPRPVYPNELPHSYSDPLPARQKKPLHSKQLPHALVISGLEYATDMTQRTFANVLSEKQVILERKHNKVDAETFSRQTETDDDDGAWNLPDGFIAVYVCPLNARDRPCIHKTLVRTRHISFYLHYKHLLSVG